MIGNILSAVVYVILDRSFSYFLDLTGNMTRWIQSTTFASYMISRVIGGLSEGNVQLAM